MAKIGTDIEYAAELLNAGKLVAIPTDTAYGIAGNALDANLIESVFGLKKRPLSSPLVVQVNSPGKFNSLIQNVPQAAKILAENFWPGPLTLILEKSELAPDILVSGGKLIGVRIPDHMLTLELLSLIDFPLAVPSASIHGDKRPTSAKEVELQFGDQIEYILDGGKCTVGARSTIVGFENDDLIFYRQGALSEEEIRDTIENELDDK